MAVQAVQAIPAAQANRANKAIPVRQATPEDQPKPDKKATTVHPVVQVNQDQVVQMPRKEAPEKTEIPVRTALQATQARAANQATKVLRAAKVRTEAQAKMPNIVLVQDEEKLRKRKSRKPKMDTIWNFILPFYISIHVFTLGNNKKFIFLK